MLSPILTHQWLWLKKIMQLSKSFITPCGLLVLKEIGKANKVITLNK